MILAVNKTKSPLGAYISVGQTADHVNVSCPVEIVLGVKMKWGEEIDGGGRSEGLYIRGHVSR